MQMCVTVDPWVHICTRGFQGGGNDLSYAQVNFEVNLNKIMPNEPISIRNTREIHEIMKIATDWLFYPNWPKL